MMYTDPKHFGSIFFDVWNSFNDHGGSSNPWWVCNTWPEEPFLTMLWAHFESFVRHATGLDFDNFLSCMSAHGLSACMFLFS